MNSSEQATGVIVVGVDASVGAKVALAFALAEARLRGRRFMPFPRGSSLTGARADSKGRRQLSGAHTKSSGPPRRRRSTPPSARWALIWTES